MPDVSGVPFCAGQNVGSDVCTFFCMLEPIQLLLSKWIKKCPKCDSSLKASTDIFTFSSPVFTPTPAAVLTWTLGNKTITLDLDVGQWNITGITAGVDYGCRSVDGSCFDVEDAPFDDCLSCGCLSGACICNTPFGTNPNPGPIQSCSQFLHFCCSCAVWSIDQEIRLDPGFAFDACFQG